MEREGLQPNILNAKNHFREAEIIAQAGQLGLLPWLLIWLVEELILF